MPGCSDRPAAPIDAALARRLIEKQFPRWAGLPIHAVEPGGWDNRSFRLGSDMVVRLPSSGAYAAQVEKEQRWLPCLAPHLPLAIPAPLACGGPGEGYPWRWSVYSWIDGDTLDRRTLSDPLALVRALAAFLRALHRIDPADGPTPGPHNCHRGAPLEYYDEEARAAIAALGDTTDAPAALAVWEAALGSRGRHARVWLHGDLSAANLLLRHGALSAVIDFGCCGVGDPACDLMLAWSFFDASERAAFRAELPLDPETWARGRGWALWKAAITLAAPEHPARAAAALVLAQVLARPDRA